MKGIAILVFALAVGVNGSVLARGHGSQSGGHGHGGGHGGHHHGHRHGHTFFFGGALIGSYWVIPRYGDPEAGDFLLYCPDQAAYYPEVTSCPSAWWRVVPTGLTPAVLNTSPPSSLSTDGTAW